MARGVETPPLAGWLTADGHVLPVRVYYEDTDFSGAVYHGSLVRFLERGRSDFLRIRGVSHAPLSAKGLHFAVSEMTLSFHRAARIDDIVEVTTKVAKLSGARVVLAQAIQHQHVPRDRIMDVDVQTQRHGRTGNEIGGGH